MYAGHSLIKMEAAAMERRIVTEEDVRRVNDRRTGKIAPLVLSPEDEMFFRSIKRVILPFGDHQRVRDAYDKAKVR